MRFHPVVELAARVELLDLPALLGALENLVLLLFLHQRLL